MAKYSYDKYGNFIYGESNPETSPYYQANIVAESVDYNTIRILWQPISPNPVIGTPTCWALVKTFTGKPDDPYDGRIVIADSMERYQTSWVETFVNTTDIEINYSVWVFTEGYGWTFCGSANALIIAKTTTPDLVSKWIPRAWQNDKEGVGDSVGEYELQDLMTAITAYSIEYDKFRLMSKMLEKVNTSKYITNNYASTKLLDFGFSYEPNLGDPYYRTLAISGEKINSLKGTTEGISQYITALTHIQNKIEIGHNLILDYNDSSFEESTGRWGPNIAWTTYTIEGITPPSPNLYDIEALPRSVGLGKVTSGSNLVLELPYLPLATTIGGVIDGYSQMIPVNPGTRYIFTGWIKSASSFSIRTEIQWYNSKGQGISTTPVNSTTTIAAGSWTEFKSVSDAYRNGQIAPPGARFALISLSTTGAYPTFYIDMCQFCEWQHSLSYEDPRLIKIYLRGQEENLLLNSSFKEGIGGWFGKNVQLTHDQSSGSGSLGIYPLETIQPWGYWNQISSLIPYTGSIVWSDWVEVDPGISYTFSINKDQNLTNKIILGIEFSNVSSEENQSYVTLLGDTLYYDSFETANKNKLEELFYDVTTHTIKASPNVFFQAGDSVTIIGASNALFNGTWTVSSADTTGFYINNVYYAINANLLEVTNAYAVGTTKIYGNVNEEVYRYNNEISPDTTSVTAVAPPKTKDSGKPYARVYMLGVNQYEYLTIKNARFAPTLIEDRSQVKGDIVSLNPTYNTIYFDGNGNDPDDIVTGFDPITTQYFNTEGCFWETSKRYNFVNNSNFETNITGWSAVGSSVLSSNTSSGYSGTKSLKVTGSSGSAGGATTTVYLPYPAVGGESVAISAYVKGALGTFSITSPDANAFPYSGDKSFYLDATQATSWTRIDNVITLNQNQTSFTLNVNSVLDSGSTIYSIDAVQAEWGQVPSHFITLTDPGTFSFPNPNQTSNTLWSAYNQNINNGKSSYISEWGVKFNRLFATLPNFVPTGSSWTIKTGWPKQPSADLEESLIPSSSFENDLGDWNSDTAHLKRVPYMGLHVDYVTHGIAYAEVTTLRSVTDEKYNFGISSDKIYVNPNKGYYGSVAVRPVPGTSASGFYGIVVEAYNENDVLIQTFNNTLRVNTDLITNGIAFTSSTTAPTTPVEGDRWLEPDSGRMYTWVIDGDSSQWAEVDEYNYYVGSNLNIDSRYAYSATPPINPIVGSRWIDTDTQIGYTWFDDGDTQQWVEFAVIYSDSSSYVDETYSPRWAYLNIVIPKGELLIPIYGGSPTLVPPTSLETAAYVKFKVECTPDVFATGQAFQIDRAIFRE
jgi:hypothetical protein